MNLSSIPLGDETLLGVSGVIKDASTQKEAVNMAARMNRDKIYQKMYDKSGLKVKFALVEVAPGVKVQMMQEVEMREAPKFDEPIPEVSEHPVWKLANNVVDKGTNVFLWSSAIRELGSWGKQATANREASVVRPEVVKVEPFVVEPTIIETPAAQIVQVPGPVAP
jgi:hypothetical protein